MKNIRGSKLIVVIIRIYMEISKGKSLCSYFYLKQAKISCVLFCLFSFFLLSNLGTAGWKKSCQREGLAPVGSEKCCERE
jgi:hypothetical protein